MKNNKNTSDREYLIVPMMIPDILDHSQTTLFIGAYIREAAWAGYKLYYIFKRDALIFAPY